MKHLAGPDFWDAYNALPKNIRELAGEKFQLLKENPRHPSVKLKKVNDLWSVRIGSYRALGEKIDGGIFWYWIGTHEEYDQRIA